nr:three prime repair exonuclease 2-like [Lytechinus pictus]
MDSVTGLTIKSFVFLDFETSHLYPKDRPKIIELSLIAINRAGLLDPNVHTSLYLAKNNENSTFDLSKVSLPRIVDKLTLCLDPGKYTSPHSARLTKMDKRKLDINKKLPFDEGVVTMLNIFLSRQDAPVCLVAHNGMRFDFPILRSELSGLTTGDPPAELYCLDTLKGFRAGFGATETQGVKKKREWKDKQNSVKISGIANVTQDQTHFNSSGITFAQSQDRRSGDFYHRTNQNGVDRSLLHNMTLHKSHDAKMSLSSSKNPIHHAKQLPNPQRKHPHLHFVILLLPMLKRSRLRTSQARPVLPQHSGKRNQRLYSRHTVDDHPPKRQRVSYSLVNIFKRTFEREPPHSHSAEDDVVSLIKVLLPVISDFVSWADENASPFKDCKLYYDV